MSKQIPTEIPDDYPVCLHSDCPQAATCLHQIVYPELQKDQTYLKLVNPMMCTKDGQCKFYRDSKPVRFARGFINFQKRMFPDQYDKFRITLEYEFGRNEYFRRRRGEKIITPKEQKIILDILRKVGVTDDLEFDRYDEQPNWYD